MYSKTTIELFFFQRNCKAWHDFCEMLSSVCLRHERPKTLGVDKCLFSYLDLSEGGGFVKHQKVMTSVASHAVIAWVNWEGRTRGLTCAVHTWGGSACWVNTRHPRPQGHGAERVAWTDTEGQILCPSGLLCLWCRIQSNIITFVETTGTYFRAIIILSNLRT